MSLGHWFWNATGRAAWLWRKCRSSDDRWREAKESRAVDTTARAGAKLVGEA